MFSFVRNHQTVFQSGWTILRSRQQSMKVPVPAGPYQRLVLSLFWILAILLGMRWYFIVILICISLMTCDGEHVFLCLFAICISSVVRCLLKPLAHFLIDLFSYWDRRVLCIFWWQSFIRCVVYKYFLPVCGLSSSHFLDIVFHRSFHFN